MSEFEENHGSQGDVGGSHHVTFTPSQGGPPLSPENPSANPAGVDEVQTAQLLTPVSGILDVPSRDGPPPTTEGTIPPNFITLLTNLVDRVEALARTTNQLFEEMATPAVCHDVLDDRNIPRRREVALEGGESHLRGVQRNFFGEFSLGLNHQNPPSQRQPERSEDALAWVRQQLDSITSRVHQATSDAPQIDEVLRETQNVPFTSYIHHFRLPPLERFSLPTYDGTSDPSQHLTMFNIAMTRSQLTDEERDPGYCRAFVENLQGEALRWFSRLKPGSISSFDQLSTIFLKHYSMFIEQGASIADLWAMSQSENEPLRDFIRRFKEVASRITIDDEAALPALSQALWFDSIFKRELKLNKPWTLEDALHRANTYIEYEEEVAAMHLKRSQY